MFFSCTTNISRVLRRSRPVGKIALLLCIVKRRTWKESRSVKTGIRGCHGVGRPALALALFIYETGFFTSVFERLEPGSRRRREQRVTDKKVCVSTPASVSELAALSDVSDHCGGGVIPVATSTAWNRPTATVPTSVTDRRPFRRELYFGRDSHTDRVPTTITKALRTVPYLMHLSL